MAERIFGHIPGYPEGSLFENRVELNESRVHMPAWPRFNRSVGSDGSAGIWHKKYIVERANYEAIYSNMPCSVSRPPSASGVGGRESARRLMRGENKPAVPSPE